MGASDHVVDPSSPPARASPFLSVVLPAYSRPEFLLQAVRSVVSQRRSPTEPEIIVVKNFGEPVSDGYLERERVATIDFGSTTYGATIARAIERSRGEVVAFLEDDDAFDPGKIERLHEVFGGGSTVSYYHNDYREIDGRGATPPPSAPRRSIDRRVQGRDAEVFDGPSKVGSFSRMADSVPEAHLSCVAMRRAALLRVLPRLARVPIGVDFFLFYAGLASDGAVMIDPGKLTVYRRHSSSASLALSTDPGWYPRLVDGTREMRTETRGMLTDLGARELLPILDRELSAHELYVRTTAPRPDRRAVAAAIAGVLRHPGALRAPGRRQLFLRSCLVAVAPGAAARRHRAAPHP